MKDCLWLRAVAILDESVAVQLTFNRIRERLVWSEQIEKSYDRNQPTTEVPDGEPTDPRPTLALVARLLW